MHVILRFDFLDITVRHEIGKRYIPYSQFLEICKNEKKANNPNWAGPTRIG